MKAINELVKRVNVSIKQLKTTPLESLGLLIPVAMTAIAIVAALLGYLLFIMQGGYSGQASFINEAGESGLLQGFTWGSVGLSTSGPIAVIIGALFLAQIAVIFLSYIKTESKTKKIIMSVDLLMLLALFFLFVGFAVSYGKSLGVIDSQVQSQNVPFGDLPSILAALPFLYSLLTALAVVVFILLVIVSDYKWMLGYGVLGLGISFFVVPLALLLIENIVKLGILAIFLVIICLVVCFLFAGFGGSSSTSGEMVSSLGGSSSQNNKVADNSSNGKTKKQKNKAYIEYYNQFGGIKLFKTKGFFENIIESDNGIIARRVCSLEELQKGKFHIYEKETGREIKESEIPWRQ